jgi:hypothetical protein
LRGVSKDGHRRMDSRPSFETRVKNAPLRMREEIVSHALRSIANGPREARPDDKLRDVSPATTAKPLRVDGSVAHGSRRAQERAPHHEVSIVAHGRSNADHT